MSSSGPAAARLAAFAARRSAFSLSTSESSAISCRAGCTAERNDHESSRYEPQRVTQRPPSSSHCQDGGQVGAEEGRQVGKGIGSRFCVSKCSNDYGVLSSRGKSVALGVCIICNPGVQAPSLAVGNALPRASGGGNTFSVGAKLHVTSFIPPQNSSYSKTTVYTRECNT